MRIVQQLSRSKEKLVISELLDVNSMNGLLEEWRDAPLFQKPNFACASRTQNWAIEFTF
jgi:hypothetical protein